MQIRFITLMPEELRYADVVRQALTYPACHILVLLVGHSPEPLLQTISVFQPRRVVLLLNQWYGSQRGETRGAELAGWITGLLAPQLPWGRPPWRCMRPPIAPMRCFRRSASTSWPTAGRANRSSWTSPAPRRAWMRARSFAEQLMRQHARLRQPPGSIFESNELLLAYARDELARIERLVGTNEDNRSALLRAAGLDELLLKARWLRLWHTGWIEVWDGSDRQHLGNIRALRDPDLAASLYDALLNHQDTDYMRSALLRATQDGRRSSGAPAPYFRIKTYRDQVRESFRLRPALRAPALTGYAHAAQLTGETLTDLRNQAIHMYLGVTQAIAQAAVKLAAANLADFEARWTALGGAPSTPPSAAAVSCLPWETLCWLRGLESLPMTDEE